MRKEIKEKYIKSIIGINKERDYSILEYQALNPTATYTEIKQNLNLEITQDRICLIVNDNWDIVLKLFCQLNPIAMKEGRSWERAKAYIRKGKAGIETKKDPLDILNDMEDDGVKIDNSNHRTYVVMDYSKLTEEDIERIHGINKQISSRIFTS